jgi:terminase large subunit-like protein
MNLTSQDSLKKSKTRSNVLSKKWPRLTQAKVKAALERERTRRNQRKIDRLFPDTGPLRRELYVKHLKFFRAGAVYRERLFMAGNRCGKTTAGAYEMAVHLTGQYPHWWEGRRFDGAIDAWAAG